MGKVWAAPDDEAPLEDAFTPSMGAYIGETSDVLTLYERQMAASNDLAYQNQTLLTQNAALERQLQSQTLQNEVLIHEASSAFFLYGAGIALVFLMIGLILGAVLGKPKKARW